jgi:hypothetical protein
MLLPGTRFSKAHLSRDISPNAIGEAGRWSNGRFRGPVATPSGLPGDGSGFFPEKAGQ